MGEGPSRVLALLTACCYGATTIGPEACVCWEVVYDEEQVDVAPVDPASIEPWPEMCVDCAYRPDSPERSDDERYAHAEMLDELPHGDVPFWCHRGMRKVKEWRHPSGIVVQADGDYYEPPQRDGVPFQYDGTPARQCAGWATRHELAKRGAL